MKKVLISFGNEKYYKSLDFLEKTAVEIGKVDQFIRYTQEELKNTDFWKKNQFILSQPRGAGYWIWKPYIILKTLESLDIGDIVIYSDAGAAVVNDLTPLFELADKKEMILFANGDWKNHTWTKKDCYVLMGCDSAEYWNGQHLTATFSLWKKTENNISFLNEWQKLMRDPRIVTDDPNMCGANLMQFRDHRHDQSVLSLLAIKYKKELFRDPGQFGNDFKDRFPNSPYEQLFNHHRGKW